MTGHEINLRSLLIPDKKLSQDNLYAAVEWVLNRVEGLEQELALLNVDVEQLPESTIEGYKKAYALLLKGMKSQSELMNDLKQENREQKTIITDLELQVEQLKYSIAFGERSIGDAE